MPTAQHLVIDEGNSRLKAGVFTNKELTEVVSFDNCGPVFIDWYLPRSSFPTLVSSVKKEPLEGVTMAGKNLTLYLNHLTLLPITNRYLTPETLGTDRLANACGGAFLHPGKPVLTIDAGTCLKYDFVNADAEYLGGSISPGLTMRLEAMHTFTGKLPLIQPEPFNRLYGRDTRESLLAGAWGGMLNEMEKTIEKYRASHPSLVVMLTGGDMPYFEAALKNSIFAPHLTLIGLESIISKNVS
ncbi:MAG: type III pantothenate kinase [Flavobacteriales bacterium]